MIGAKGYDSNEARVARQHHLKDGPGMLLARAKCCGNLALAFRTNGPPQERCEASRWETVREPEA